MKKCARTSLPGAFFPIGSAIIKQVMHMKKAMIVLLVLALVLTGLFLWKGGHHAIYVSEVLEEWLDADAADQSLTVQLQIPGLSTDPSTGRVETRMSRWSMTADSFWTEYADDEVYGLTIGGATAYLRGRILYMDTGKAYTLPDLSGLKASLRKLTAGLLLRGRMTKAGDSYTLTMKTDELDLTADFELDRTVRSIRVSASLPDGTSLQATLTSQVPQAHPIPTGVADAMVLAKMEPPMSLSEPLEVLLPALEQLLPLSGDLQLGITSGILSLSETVDLTIDGGKVSIARGGIVVDVKLPAEFPELSPAAMALLALRSGTFTRQGDSAQVSISIPGDATGELVEALIPQAEGLGIIFGESSMVLTIAAGRLSAASIAAGGTVPFLFTTIPVDFSANLTVK